MEGYDVEVVGEISNDLYCTICLKLMRDAIQMKCGHGMCQACFQKLADSCKTRNIEVTCPSCRQVVKEDQIICNMMLDRVIAAMKVKCSNQKLGCEWFGVLQSSDNHLLKDCNYHMMKCSFEGCNKGMMRNNLSKHEATCQYKAVQCKYCMDAFLSNQFAGHVKVCEYYPMKCRNEMCSELIPRCKIDEHLQLDCLYEEIECSFHSIGCCAKFPRNNLNNHLQFHNQKHMLLLLQDSHEKNKLIEALKEENRVVTQNVEESEKQLKTKIVELERGLPEIKKKSVEANGQLDQYEARYEDVLTKLSNIEHKFQDLTCLAPDELTGSVDHKKGTVESKSEENESLQDVKSDSFDLSDDNSNMNHLEVIAAETFANKSIDLSLMRLEKESKSHFDQWLSKEMKGLQGLFDMKKADLPLSESYIKMVVGKMTQDCKVFNFQQISRMEKYCHFLRSNQYKELKIFENGKNAVQIKNRLFVKYQYSKLDNGHYKTIIKADEYTAKLCKWADKILILKENIKEAYLINKHLQKSKLTVQFGSYETALCNGLIEYFVNDWFLLEIVY